MTDAPRDPQAPAGASQPSAEAPERTRVRFKRKSRYVRLFELPPGAVATIVGSYMQDGAERVCLKIEGVPGKGYASGVPRSELDDL